MRFTLVAHLADCRGHETRRNPLEKMAGDGRACGLVPTEAMGLATTAVRGAGTSEKQSATPDLSRAGSSVTIWEAAAVADPSRACAYVECWLILKRERPHV
jgi:hypothetical protein